MAAEPLILYVPGLKPKPEPQVHRRELFRCLHEGVRRVDAPLAERLQQHAGCFDVVGWTYDFYGEHRDIELDLPGIEGVLEQQSATAEDKAFAGSWQRRVLRWIYRTGDYLPFLIPQLADENMALHLRDLRRYVHNDNDIAEYTRRLLKVPLRAADRSGRPVLLIGHSMGSVIAYDALWQMSRKANDASVDWFVTMGSPLGQHYIQRRLLSHDAVREERYPDNIGTWINISAIGELTAIDMNLRNDYGEMLEMGLVRRFEDHQVYNYFHLDGELNVHAEYGYLVNDVTARLVCEWLERNLP